MSARASPARVDVTLEVNGEHHELTVEPRRLLLDLLRDDLGLTGAKRGCEEGVCGCCTVLLDGRSVKPCLLLAAQASGKSITTVESLADADGKLHAVQEAFVRHGALQCGYCTPGFLMTTMTLVAAGGPMNEQQVREALVGNICRCTGYVHIVEAVLELVNGNSEKSV
jgi:aerobic-type carbon monoxide dehydrogenase small subunit (CoxS/CutS family)